MLWADSGLAFVGTRPHRTSAACKSSTGLTFNYRASCRARSHAEFTAKTGVVVEEADESLGWLEFMDAARLLPSSQLQPLITEARELVAIFSASYGTARWNQRNR
ncbi:MAG TPA: four helix bundle protein [Nitrospira sp.]|nr:four helix bundle protein [Nitrospira sp.]